MLEKDSGYNLCSLRATYAICKIQVEIHFLNGTGVVQESLIINIHIVHEINFAISLARIIDFQVNNQIHIWYNTLAYDIGTTLAYRWWSEAIHMKFLAILRQESSDCKLKCLKQVSVEQSTIPTECKTFGYHELSCLIPASLIIQSINHLSNNSFLQIHELLTMKKKIYELFYFKLRNVS